jgi:hypothetical protein
MVLETSDRCLRKAADQRGSACLRRADVRFHFGRTHQADPQRSPVLDAHRRKAVCQAPGPGKYRGAAINQPARWFSNNERAGDLAVFTEPIFKLGVAPAIC